MGVWIPLALAHLSGKMLLLLLKLDTHTHTYTHDIRYKIVSNATPFWVSQGGFKGKVNEETNRDKDKF